jgi:uncharacterized delta-60 repeat protein
VVAAAALAVLASTAAWADPGRLDDFFSGDGRQTAFAAGGTGSAVAIDHHGRIVVAGSTLRGKPDIALARFTSAGRPDPTFDGDGRVVTDLGGSDYAFDVAIDDGGGIVVVGERDAARDTFAVLRYRPNGSLDPSFGTGGVVLTSFGRRFQSADAVALGPGGGIVVAGATSNGRTGRSALARYHHDGSLDRSFGGDGRVTLDLSASDERIEDLALLADGRIVAAGFAETGLIPAFAVAALLPDGSLDPRFGRHDRGWTIISLGRGADIAHAVAAQPDGHLVVAGYAAAGGADEWGVARLGPKGRLDREFGHDGIVVTSFGDPYESAFGVAVQANGKIVVAGTKHRGGSGPDLAVLRLKPGGGVDRSFGEAGLATADFFGGADDGRDLVIQANGKLVVAGDCVARGTRRFAVARFLTR